MLTVRADLVDGSILNPKLGDVPFLVIEISTTVYVNRLNTSKATDWHLPTVSQQESYVSRLRKNLRARLEASCLESAVWIDSTSMTCGLPDVPERSQLFM